MSKKRCGLRCPELHVRYVSPCLEGCVANVIVFLTLRCKLLRCRCLQRLPNFAHQLHAAISATDEKNASMGPSELWRPRSW